MSTGFEVIVVVIFLIVVGLLVLFGYRLGFWIKRQANKENKRLFAPIPRPGSFSFVTLEGKVVNIIESVIGWRLEEMSDGSKCFVPGSKKESNGFFAYILEHYLGVVWIGLFATIRIFPKWTWSEFKQTEVQEGNEKIPKFSIEIRKEEPVSEFFFQFPYPVITDDVEIKGNIRVKIVAVLTVLHLHPTRAFFLNKDPVALFNAMIQSAFRSYVAEMEFDDVKKIKANKDDEITGNSFWHVLEKLNGIKLDEKGKPDYKNIDPLSLFGKLGFYVARAEVVQVETTGDTAKAIEAERIATLNAKAKIAEANGDAQAAIRRAEGDRDAMKARLEVRKQWVEETIVGPTGGAGQHVANVLIAEQFASPDSNVSVLGANFMVNVKEPQKQH